MITLVLCLKELTRTISYYRLCKPQASDMEITGRVVGNLWAILGHHASFPIVSYRVGGKEKRYRFLCMEKLEEYPRGTEVKLQLSAISGLAYIKKDLKLGLISWSIYSFFAGLVDLYFGALVLTWLICKITGRI